jgi:hypothetical protein
MSKRVSKTLEPNNSGLSPRKTAHLQLVKKIRLMSVRGLTSKQKSVLQRFLHDQKANLTEQWILINEFGPTDVCLATHKSFFNNDLWIEASHTVVLCNSNEYESLDYEHQIRIAEIKRQLIKKLNEISRSSANYAFKHLPNKPQSLSA